MSRPARRSIGRLDGGDRPIALPHLETADGRVRFLGEPLDPQLLGPELLPLWRSCDGDRELASWSASDRATISAWHAAGLLVAAPPARTGPVPELTVVSPHPDDAQLALGGVLAALGGRVVDVFTEETWTRRPYYLARPALAARLLLAEERVACRVLDVAVELLGQTDGAARPAWADGFFLADAAAPAPTAAEPELFAVVADQLRDALAGTGPVLTPLAVGGHVDHALARDAVLTLADAGDVDPSRIVFYEDMPYSLFSDPAALAQQLAARAGLGPLRPVTLPAPTAAVKREALWTYRLQVTEGIITRVIRYGERRCPGVAFAERVWLPQTSTLVEPLMNLG